MHLIYQAAVMDLKYGAFVTAIAFEFEGDSHIIQCVTLQFSEGDRDGHYSVVQLV
jgi:hypothetical protein